MTLSITSPAFGHESRIPARYTCDGDNLSPPLEFAGVPATTESLVLVIDDPDAPTTTWVHWLVYGLPADCRGLSPEEGLPAGAHVARNSWGRRDYSGPCPPRGRHRYYHHLFALDVTLPNLGATANRGDIERAMAGHIVASATLIGTYRRG